MKKAKEKKSPDLMGELPKPRRGRPPKQPSKPAIQIAEELERDAKKMLEAVAIIRGKKKQ